MSPGTTTAELVEVDGRRLSVSSLDRVLFPETGFTKAELIDYYVRIAEVLLPHVQGRAVTLHRFPYGVGHSQHFYQTRTPPHPDWVRTATLHFSSTGKTFDAPVIDDCASLVWAANLSSVELHPYLNNCTEPDRPLLVCFDLDPGPPAGLLAACTLALLLRDVLDAAGLSSYPKTSGGKGLHVYVPLISPAAYADTKRFARDVARALTREHPELAVDRMTRSLRTGKVFIDWSQNDAGKSTIAPYSVKAMAEPTVSMPLAWDEVAGAVDRGRARHLWFSPRAAVDRADRHGDLFAAVSTQRQRLP